MKTLEKRRARAALIAEARGILTKADTETRDLTDEETAAWKAKLDEAGRMLVSIEMEERQAKLDAENAVSIGGATPPPAAGTGAVIQPGAGNQQRTAGSGFLNAVRSIGHGGRDRRMAAEFAENVLHDSDLARALSASVASGGGFAVPSILAQEFIEFLRPASVVRSAEPRVLPLVNGNLAMPRINGGATASYLGENQPIGATQQTFGQVKLVAKKLAALVPISNDLIRFANPQTDAVIRQDLVASVAQCEDLNFLRGDGTQYTPRGIRNWTLAANVFNASATVDIPHITTDLGTAISDLLTANVKVTLATGYWFMSPRTFVFLKTLRNPTTGQYAFPELQGPNPTLLGYRVAYTSQIPINLTSGTTSEIYFVNMADAIIGDAVTMQLDVSMEATYVDATGANVSAFANDQTVIRIIEENDFAMRYDQSSAVIAAVPY